MIRHYIDTKKLEILTFFPTVVVTIIVEIGLSTEVEIGLSTEPDPAILAESNIVEEDLVVIVGKAVEDNLFEFDFNNSKGVVAIVATFISIDDFFEGSKSGRDVEEVSLSCL